MSGLDVEALLDSAAADKVQTKSDDRDSSRRGNGSPRNDRANGHDSHRTRRRNSSSPEDDRKVLGDKDAGAGSPAGDYYRGGRDGRERSRSPGRHYRPGSGRGRDRDDGDRYRNRDRHDDRDRRGHGRNGGGRRNSSPRGVKEAAEPAPTEDERDRRTVFVQQLAARLRSKELIAFFEKAGPVKEAQIVKDRVSGRSKGVGYVEFRKEESVAAAIAMTGQKLLGIPIIAQLTEAEKNRQARTAEGSSGNANSVPFHRLYVGNIHFSITEEDLQNVFEPFGELEFVQLQKEETGRSRGYGFVQFRDPTQAREALEKMNGFELANRPIRVGLGNDKFTPESTANLLQRFQGQARTFQGSAFSGHGGRGIHAGGSGTFDRASAREQDKQGAGYSALDDTDVAGVNFSNFSRDSLMRKLARTDDPADGKKADANSKSGPASKAKQPAHQPQMASRCIVLRNMFNPEDESGESWVKELEEDVSAECEDKYGHVVHLALDPNTQGDIYIKFDRVQGGDNAIKGLNGRYFGGRMITAQPMIEAIYTTLYPKTKEL